MDRYLAGRTHPENPADWPDVTEVVEIQEFASTFVYHCETYPANYDFRLRVVRLFSLSVPRHEEEFLRMSQRLVSPDPNVRLLYHGTSLNNAKGIIEHGFERPHRPGWFGTGIYFADTPLKTWQFSKSVGMETGFILVCEVALGSIIEVITPSAAYSPYFFGDKFARARCYDSVKGLSRVDGGVLRTPEYMVFNPTQILPRFLVEVKQTRP